MRAMRQVIPLCVLAAAVGTAMAERPAQSVGGVSYVAGGVGMDSMAALRAREKEFNLKLVFTLKEGNYLAGVNVLIADAMGKSLLDKFADGPIFMVRLPAGDYTVSASYEGVTQTRKVTAGNHLRTEYLRWASKPGLDFPVPEAGTHAVAPDAAPAMEIIARSVGEEAQARLAAIENRYNLKLVFTLTEGNYVADVDVAIKEAHGKSVIKRLIAGPMVLARLPAGEYAVTATYSGNTVTREINVGDRLKTEYFRWPSKPGVDFPVALRNQPGS